MNFWLADDQITIYWIKGEGGKAYTVNREDLSPAEQLIFDKGWEDNAYNQYASDRISVRRYLPDYREGA